MYAKAKDYIGIKKVIIMSYNLLKESLHNKHIKPSSLPTISPARGDASNITADEITIRGDNNSLDSNNKTNQSLTVH